MNLWSGLLLLGLIVLACWLARRLIARLPSTAEIYPEMDERHLGDHR